MSYMFSDCVSLKEIKFSNKFNTSKVINMESMFSGCYNLTSLDLSNFDTTNVTNMHNMFYGCNSLTNIIGINKLNTKNAINKDNILPFLKYEWLNIFKNIIIIGKGKDQINLNYEKNYFYKRDKDYYFTYSNKDYDYKEELILLKMDLKEFIIKNNLKSYVTYIDLSNFDSSNITDMSNMFLDCASLRRIKLTNKFNTSKVINMESMFRGCKNLTSLDLSNFDTTNVTNMNNMFYGCYSLKKIIFSNKFKTNKVINMNYMFFNCSSLINIIGINELNTKNVINMNYIFYELKYDWNYFYKNKIIIEAKNERNEYELILYNEKFKVNAYMKIEDNYNDYLENVFYPILIIDNQGDFLRGRILSLIKNKIKINYNKLRESGIKIKEFLLTYIDNIIDLSEFFVDCSLLTYIDLSNFDSSKVTDMSYMFSDCTSLEEIKLSNKFNTSKVINMESMFSGCKNLASLDLSNFNTRNVTNMSGMFSGCSSINEIIFSYKFDTSKVTYMNSMFKECKNLISLDLSNFDYSNSIEIHNMFKNCNSLKKIEGLENILYNHNSPDMFIGCDIKNLKRNSNVSGCCISH